LTEQVPKTSTTITLTGLKKFIDYRITVYAVNSYGKKMSEIMAKTGEDGKWLKICFAHAFMLTNFTFFFSVPDAAPIITRSTRNSHKSIKFTWSPTPLHKRNGIIRGYIIYYKELNTGNEWPKWQSYTIEKGNVTSGVVTGLRSFVWYCFKMSAYTSKGQYSSWKTDTPCWTIRSKSTSGT
jgi:hypothetical protein